MKNRGFSLLELAVILAIVAIAVAVAIPSLTRAKLTSDINHDVRLMRAHISRSRHEASSGKDYAPGGADGRVRYAGIKIIDAKSYSIFVSDKKSLDTTEVLLVVVFDHSLEILTPDSSSPIVFQANGTLTNDSADKIVLRNTETQKLTKLVVSMTGAVDRF